MAEYGSHYNNGYNYQYEDGGYYPEDNQPEYQAENGANYGATAQKEQRFVIGLDYGTTYTGVAFATPNSNYLPLEEIDLIEDWGPMMGNHKKIPSVISFSQPSAKMEQQWGYDLSEDAISIVHTKLQLDLQDVAGELDLIIQALDGMDNFSFEHIRKVEAPFAFSDKSADQVVTAYLTKVFQHLSEAIVNFSESFRVRVPVDIVVTVPTQWSYRAKNSTFRALSSAGFNQEHFPKLASVLFITEPEAAALYTARYLKNEIRGIFQKPNSCFVLCDAGGGTVDVVSYKVKQFEPSLVLERIGLPTGDKCGAIYIDIMFKEWLRDLLGDDYYKELDPSLDIKKITSHTCESQAMRQLMKSFDVLKKQFRRDHRDMALDLPPPLENLTLPGKVDCGEIKITNAQMTEFFNFCVGKILGLLRGQFRQIEYSHRKVKNVFLVGGFAESRYLQEELELSLRLSKVTLRRPDTSWTAVVRGAVLHGIEKDKMSNLSMATACPRHFGISRDEPYSNIHHNKDDITLNPITNSKMIAGQLDWLLCKGDLVLSDSPTTVSQTITLSFREGDKMKRRLAIYSYPDDDDDRPENIKNSLDILPVSHVLKYDLASLDRKLLKKSLNKHGFFYNVRLKLTLTLSANRLNSVLSWHGKTLATGVETW